MDAVGDFGIFKEYFQKGNTFAIVFAIFDFFHKDMTKIL